MVICYHTKVWSSDLKLSKNTNKNLIKTEEQIEGIAASCAILNRVLGRLQKAAKEGVKLSFLDKLAYDLITDEGGVPSFLNYRPEGADHAFPASVCTSLNNIVVHGTPRDYALQKGDVLKLDLGVNLDGYFSDSAATVYIGDEKEMPKEIKRLIDGTRIALTEAIKVSKVGNSLGDIGWAIESVANKFKLGIAEGLSGHGVGLAVHEDPFVWNFGNPKTGIKLREGMVLAIEPMFTLGGDEIVSLSDGSYATEDGSIAAHFEHTIAINKSGPVILT